MPITANTIIFLFLLNANRLIAFIFQQLFSQIKNKLRKRFNLKAQP